MGVRGKEIPSSALHEFTVWSEAPDPVILATILVMQLPFSRSFRASLAQATMFAVPMCSRKELEGKKDPCQLRQLPRFQQTSCKFHITLPFVLGWCKLQFTRLQIIANTAITFAPASYFLEASTGSQGHKWLQESLAVQPLVEHTGGRLTDEEEDGY